MVMRRKRLREGLYNRVSHAAVVSGASSSPGAVFMRDTNIKAARLGVTNSKLVTVKWSMKGTMKSGVVTQGSFAGQVLFQSDPNTAGEVTAGVAPGICFAPENTGICQISMNNSVGVTPGTDDVKIVLSPPYTGWFTDGVWNHYVLTVNTGNGDWGMAWADGSQADMVDLRALGIASASISANCVPDWNNVNGLMIGASTWAPSGGGMGELGDIYVGMECLSNGSGVIPLATLRKFYAANKAQNLTGFPTGRRPEILLVGGAAGMLTNLGTAAPSGGFVVAPSPWEAFWANHDGFAGHENARLDDAPYGPGQTAPTGPYRKWMAIGNELVGAVSTELVSPASFPIALNDLLVFSAGLQDRNGAFNHAISLPPLLKTAAGANQPNTWASLTGGSLWPSSDVAAFNVGYKKADAADIRMAESYAERDATLVATSATSLTWASGALPSAGAAFNQTFQTGKGFVAGDLVEVYANTPTVNDRTNRFWATVNSYNSGTGVANLTAFASQGSITAGTGWTMVLGGWRWSWTMAGSGTGSSLQFGQATIINYGQATVGATAFGTAGWTNPGTITAPSITTTHAGARVVTGYMAVDQDAHMTPHAGSTWREQYRQYKKDALDDGGGCGLIIADEIKATAGVYPAQTVDLKALDGVSTFNGFVLGYTLELS